MNSSISALIDHKKGLLYVRADLEEQIDTNSYDMWCLATVGFVGDLVDYTEMLSHGEDLPMASKKCFGFKFMGTKKFDMIYREKRKTWLLGRTEVATDVVHRYVPNGMTVISGDIVQTPFFLAMDDEVINLLTRSLTGHSQTYYVLDMNDNMKKVLTLNIK